MSKRTKSSHMYGMLLMRPKTQGRTWWEVRPVRLAGAKSGRASNQVQQFGLYPDVFGRPATDRVYVVSGSNVSFRKIMGTMGGE